MKGEGDWQTAGFKSRPPTMREIHAVAAQLEKEQ
jgi:hypothetical protein